MFSFEFFISIVLLKYFTNFRCHWPHQISYLFSMSLTSHISNLFSISLTSSDILPIFNIVDLPDILPIFNVIDLPDILPIFNVIYLVRYLTYFRCHWPPRYLTYFQYHWPPKYLTDFQCHWPPQISCLFSISLTSSDILPIFNVIDLPDILPIFNIIDLPNILPIFNVIDLLRYLTYFQCHWPLQISYLFSMSLTSSALICRSHLVQYQGATGSRTSLLRSRASGLKQTCVITEPFNYNTLSVTPFISWSIFLDFGSFFQIGFWEIFLYFRDFLNDYWHVWFLSEISPFCHGPWHILEFGMI